MTTKPPVINNPVSSGENFTENNVTANNENLVIRKFNYKVNKLMLTIQSIQHELDKGIV